jgi:hypothetical protein
VSFWRTDTRLDFGRPGGRLPRFFRDNGLALVAFALFFVSWGVQAVMGLQVYNEDRQVHHHALVGFWQYLRTWHFLEATMENWESEFLQMGVFVVLTSCLVQKGSAESKDPDEGPEPSSGSWFWDHSLSIFLFSMFLISFALHAVGGWGTYNEQQRDQGQAVVSLLGFMATPTFWFQSTQNWESEFLSVGVLILATIFLRERGSPQSKKVDAPDTQTGSH